MFENRSVYNMAAMEMMVRIAARKDSRRRWLLRQGILIGSGIVALACGALLLSVYRFLALSERMICVVSLLAGVIALGKGLLFRKMMARKLWRNLVLAGDTMERHFYFYQSSFVGARPYAETTYAYEAVRKAYETADYFYLLLNDGSSILMDKNGFIRGRTEEFRKFLGKKLGRPPEFVR